MCTDIHVFFVLFFCYRFYVFYRFMCFLLVRFHYVILWCFLMLEKQNFPLVKLYNVKFMQFCGDLFWMSIYCVFSTGKCAISKVTLVINNMQYDFWVLSILSLLFATDIFLCWILNSSTCLYMFHKSFTIPK